MPFQVFFTDDAARDLEELYTWIASHDSPENANYVLDHMEQACSSLGENPQRGVYPQELAAIGLREYREVFFKSYRIIYRVIGDSAYIMLIADGRRDMQSLLQRRLLQASR